jgi:hypothetical protein
MAGHGGRWARAWLQRAVGVKIDSKGVQRGYRGTLKDIKVA